MSSHLAIWAVALSCAVLNFGCFHCSGIGGTGRCAGPSETEPNDGMFEADELDVSISGVLCGTRGDEDWWVLRGGTNSTLSFNLSYDMADGDIDIEAGDVTGMVLDGSAGVSGEEQLFAISPGGELYVRVYPFLGENFNPAGAPYTATASFCSAAGPDEIEPNDETWEANPATDTFAGNICNADIDYWRYDAVSGQTLSFYMVYDATTADLDVLLLNETGALLGGSSGSDGTESFDYTVGISGPLYFAVYPFAAVTTPGSAYEAVILEL